MDTDCKFKPGMLVVLCETWPHRGKLLHLAAVKTVGKQQVKLSGGDTQRYNKLDGTAMGKGPYRWQAIKPLTKKLLAEAEAAGIINARLAIGHQLPEE